MSNKSSEYNDKSSLSCFALRGVRKLSYVSLVLVVILKMIQFQGYKSFSNIGIATLQLFRIIFLRWHRLVMMCGADLFMARLVLMRGHRVYNEMNHSTSAVFRLALFPMSLKWDI